LSQSKRPSNNHDDNDDDDALADASYHNKQEEGIRLNKVFKATHSRREADKMIESGRVRINGKPVLNKGGCRVVPYRDTVELDGKVIKGWEQMNAIDRKEVDDVSKQEVGRHASDRCQGQESVESDDLKTASFEYVKYFKPLGVTCTTDLRIKGNIIDSIRGGGYNPPHRVYPVGRLDKETSGLIILTSDGRLVNAVLRGERKQPKVYQVMVDGQLEDWHLQRLRVSLRVHVIYLFCCCM
jgi:16S rRNA U516 pseudouridylate synthase RsuA-like enzyme